MLYLSCIVIEKAEQLKLRRTRIKVKSSGTDKNDDEPTQGDLPNKGTLKADATIAGQEIKFPTDLNLLKQKRPVKNGQAFIYL